MGTVHPLLVKGLSEATSCASNKKLCVSNLNTGQEYHIFDKIVIKCLFRLYFDGYIQSVKPGYINLWTRVDCRDIARQSQISFTTILEII